MKSTPSNQGMTKIGGLYTMRGRVPPNSTNNKILLFDGRFDTAWRVVDFQISTDIPTNPDEVQAKLSTMEVPLTLAFWDWGSQIEIAWALTNEGAQTKGDYVLVDPDNLIVQDLWLSMYMTTEGNDCNYFIQLQKYKIPEWRGALAMVRNRAQSGSTT